MAEMPSSETVSTKQQRIAQLAKQAPQMAFTSLNHYIDLDWLQEAYDRTRKDGAVGVDGMTAAEYERDLQGNLRRLLNRAKSGTYVAPPVRRVHIPKGTGKDTRPIGIPTLEDKVLQRAAVMVLEPIYEQDFNIASPRGKSYWDRSTVWGILRNPAYKGQAAFGKTRIGPRRPRLRPYRGKADQPRRAYSSYDVPAEEWMRIPTPALVSEELFAAVNEQLAENRVRRSQQRCGEKYLLQGLLACQCCGHAFYGKPVSLSSGKGKRRDYAYYRCIGMDAYRFGGQCICDNRQVRTDLLEEAVWQDLRCLLNEPERIEREYRRRLKARQADQHGGHGDLDAVIQRVQRAIARLIDAYEDGLLEQSEFRPRIQSAKQRLAKLQAEARLEADRDAQIRELQLVIGRFQEFAERVRDGLEHADWAARRDILRAVVKRVEVGKEGVRVVYRVASSPFDDGPDRGIMQHCGGRHLAAAGQRLPARGAGRVVRADGQSPPDGPGLPDPLRGRLRHRVYR
jgi:site-specific DNA recombinase